MTRGATRSETLSSSSIRTGCLVCLSGSLESIVDLGLHPFADTFVSQDRLGEREPCYPLTLDLCPECGHVQSRSITNPDDRYRDHDYSYTSSNSAFSRGHWEEYAKEVSRKAGLKPGAFVIEIGSNDGYLAEQFAKLGYRVLGVDASPYMAKLAGQRGVPTEVAVFGESVARELLERHGRADLVVANNVFNHADDPRDFANGAALLLNEGGFFVTEQPYWRDTVETGRFDQIYHEHVSYFTVRSLRSLFERCDMRVASTEVVDYHGGSLRSYAGRDVDWPAASKAVEETIAAETERGLFQAETYREFMKAIVEKRDRFVAELRALKSAGSSIVGVGAAAKANTFLVFYGLDHRMLDFVTDASPHKQGKWTPATRIPIRGDEVFSQYGEVYALILSWNLSDRLKVALQKLNPQVRFLAPLA